MGKHGYRNNGRHIYFGGVDGSRYDKFNGCVG